MAINCLQSAVKEPLRLNFPMKLKYSLRIMTSFKGNLSPMQAALNASHSSRVMCSYCSLVFLANLKPCALCLSVSSVFYNLKAHCY